MIIISLDLDETKMPFALGPFDCRHIREISTLYSKGLNSHWTTALHPVPLLLFSVSLVIPFLFYFAVTGELNLGHRHSVMMLLYTWHGL